MPEDVPVYFERFEVGRLTPRPEGVSFAYSSTWATQPDAFPVSLKIPLTMPEAGPDLVQPWLLNLLPEGDALRTIARRTGRAIEDPLGLLESIGRETAGALSFGRPRPGDHPRYVPIASDADLERMIDELPARPFLVGEDGVSMSLAGVQEKITLYRSPSSGQLSLPVEGAASTHILKPDIKRLTGSVQNEALCLVLARRMGLTACEVTTGRAGARSYLLVTRYDRRVDSDGRVHRLHQEDFCQALGLPPGAKYEHNQTGVKGPSLGDLHKLARTYATPRAVLALTDAMVFNVAVNNVDSHAKNYSLLLQPARAELAPLYDVMTPGLWDGITQNMAQDVGGERRGIQLRRQHWERMAAACGLNARALIGRVQDLTQRLPRSLDAAIAEVAAMPGGGHSFLSGFGDAIKAHCERVRSGL